MLEQKATQVQLEVLELRAIKGILEVLVLKVLLVRIARLRDLREQRVQIVLLLDPQGLQVLKVQLERLVRKGIQVQRGQQEVLVHKVQ